MQFGCLDDVVVVHDEATSIPSPSRSFKSVATIGSSAEGDDWTSDKAASPAVGATDWIAARRYATKTAGSLSRLSSDIHAVDRSSLSPNHSVKSVVFPNPAGADTSVNAG